jgi:hypothetical protein
MTRAQAAELASAELASVWVDTDPTRHGARSTTQDRERDPSITVDAGFFPGHQAVSGHHHTKHGIEGFRERPNFARRACV